MAVLSNTGILAGSSAVETGPTAFQIKRSLRLDRGDKSFLQRDGMMPGDRRVSTFSGWIKNCQEAGSSGMLWCNNRHATGVSLQIGFSSSYKFVVINYDGSYLINMESSQYFRDYGAWYHVCVAFDTSQSLSSERVRVWINGKRITAWGTETYPSQHQILTLNIGDPQLQNDYPVSIGKQGSSDSGYLHAYLADIYWVQSHSLGPGAFGEFDSLGIWNPKEFAMPAPNEGVNYSGTASVSGDDNGNSWADWENIFDGKTTTEWFVGPGSSAGGPWTQTITFDNPITSKKGWQFYAKSQSASYGSIELSSGHKIHLSGTVTDRWFEIPGAIEVSWIKLTRTATSTDMNGLTIKIVAVDDVPLVDNQVDPTTRNTINKGRKWSDDCPKDSGTFNNFSTLMPKWFNGALNDYGYVAASENDTDCNFGFEFLPTGSKVEIYCYKNSNGGSIEYNGTDINPPTGTGNVKWVTCTNNSSPNDTLTIKVNAGQTTSDETGLSAIRVDGQILIDSAVDNSFHLKLDDISTSKSLGINSFNTSVSSATGALPIYNTSGKQGGTKGSGYRADSSAGTTDGTGLVFAWPGDTTTGEVHANINTGSSAKTVTANGDPTTDTNSSRFYGTSVAFDRTGDYLDVDGGTDFNFGTGDYTIECWFMTTDNTQNQGIFVLSDTSGGLATDESAHITAMIGNDLQVRPGDGTTKAIIDGKPSENTWHHIALTRASGTFRTFYDGALVYTKTGVTTSHADQYLAIGGYYSTSYLWKGNIQDFRIYKGVAKYTASFIAPSQRDFNLTSIVEAVTTGTVYGSTMKSDNAEARFYDPGGVDAYGVASRYNMFDGSTTTACGNPDGTNVFEWDTSSYSFSGQLRIHGRGASSSGNETNVWVNGSDSGVDLPTSGSTSWTTIGTYNSGITSIALKPNSGGSQAMQINAFEIDGTIITDTLEDSYTGIEVDSLTDTPTSYGSDGGAGGQVRGNFCTWNPSDRIDNTENTGVLLTQGNLKIQTPGHTTSAKAYGTTRGTMAVTTGKWYWEIDGYTQYGSTGTMITGVIDADIALPQQAGDTGCMAYNASDGKKWIDNTNTSYGDSYTTGDVVGVALDMDNGAIYFSKNGTWQASGVPTSGSSRTNAANTWTAGTKTLTPGISDLQEGSGRYITAYLNPGNRAFKYTAPSGFKCLCTQNLPNLWDGEDYQNDPSKYFDLVTYTGTGASYSIDGFSFQPDLVWTKARSAATGHTLYDAARGVKKKIHTHLNAAEGTEEDGLTAFNTDGWTVGDVDWENDGGKTFVSWAWDAGTAAITPSSSQTITPSAQWRNATSKFSITKFTLTGNSSVSVPHALGVKPDFMLIKRLDSTGSWYVYTDVIDGSYDYGFMHTADAFNNSSRTIYDADKFYSTTDAGDYIAYAWKGVSGYSKFGIWTGNAGVQTLNLGFQPSMIIWKCTSDSGDWEMFDFKRHGYNGGNRLLYPCYANSEAGSGVPPDLVSNGIRFTGGNNHCNGSGRTYIYAAWSLHPFKISRAR